MDPHVHSDLGQHSFQLSNINSHGNDLHDPMHGSDVQHSFQIPNINNRNEVQHVQLPSSNILMDERGENILSSLLTNPAVNDLPVNNETNFLLSADTSFPSNQILMEPQVTKYSYDHMKDSNVQLNQAKVNNSPVKKALNKAKQSPFKKRGNFEEDPSIVTYPKSDSKDYSHLDLPRHLMGKMFGLLKEGLFCDSVILSGNTEIRVHRLVLLAACPFILSKMSDLSQNASLKIELPQGIPLDVTSQLVHYLYDGKVTLTSDNVSNFARVANLFKLSHLIDICRDFVIMFGLNHSILVDKGEDINAIIIKDEDKSVATSTKVTKTTVKKPVKRSSKKSPQLVEKIAEKETDNSSVSTPSHSYGTRRASMKASTSKKNLKKDLDNSLIDSDLFLEIPPKHPIHTNAAFINSNRIKNKVKIIYKDNSAPEAESKLFSSYKNEQPITTGFSSDKTNQPITTGFSSDKTNQPITTGFNSDKTDQPITTGFSYEKNDQPVTSFNSDNRVSDIGQNVGNVPVATKNIEQSGNKNFSSNLDKKNEDNISNDKVDSPTSTIMEENMEDFSDDDDADWKPHTKLKGRAFTKKGRAARAFKKSYASYLKTKAKKAVVVPEQKETYTLRPPPKKRAKEFARTEFEELEDILSRPAEKGIVHTFSMETKSSPENKDDNKMKTKRTHRLMKASSYRASQLSAVVAQIEQKAEHLPENERHFICDICGNHYIFSKRAVTHIISVHDTELEDVISAISIRKKEKVLKMCNICGYETKEPNFFYIHFHRYFRHNVPLPKGMQPFKCDICGKECFTRFQLKDHKLIHQEGTPFICENCGQGFNSRTCLTSHVFHKHSKVRNHKCTDSGCEKSFKTRTQLLVHMRSHTGEKPFQCPDCQYKSTTRGNMRLHLTNKHKLKSDIVKNIMINLKPTEGDELLVDLEENAKPIVTGHVITVQNKQTQSYIHTCNIPSSQETEEEVYSSMSSSHGNQSSDPGYSSITNLITSPQEQQLLYDHSDPNNRAVNIQQYTGNQSLLLNNLPQDQLELLPNDPVQNNQVMSTDNLQHHIILQDPHNTDQNESRIQDINRMTMQEARSLLHQQGHVQNLSGSRESDIQHQRLSIVQDSNSKSLPQLVEVQELHPIYLQDQQNNILQRYDTGHYQDEDDQNLLRNNGTLLQKNSSNQGQLYLSTQPPGSQSHQSLPKIQITIQDRGQLEPTVHGLILSPNTSHSASQISQDTRHQMELIQTSQTKTPTKMYLVDVNNLSGVDVDTVTASVEQSQVTNAVPSVDNSSTYTDPQLLYQLYQQYNQNYQ